MPLRYEYKYFVPNSKMDMLRNMIAPFMGYDKHAAAMQEKHYTVRSIYFDTPEYDCYFEKIEGLKHRKKFRLRGYNLPDGSNGKVFFEIKRKYEVPIIKNRAPSNFDEAVTLFEKTTLENYHPDKERYPLAEENLQRFFYHYHNHQLRPVVLVIYEREAFLGKNNETIRLTFDKNLRSVAFPSLNELYLEDRARRSLTNSFILEIKFNDYFPAWMKPIIGTLGVKRQSASKYVISIKSHNFIKPKKLPGSFTRSVLLRNKRILKNV
jgi:SPX domain protein involved in polyphosphate accumulation